MHPVYVTTAGGIGWIRGFIFIEVGLITMLVITFAVRDADAAAALIGISVAVFSLGLVSLIIPRRYEIWPDRLRLVFPLWRWNLGLDTIAAARPARWWEPYAFFGVRFATAPSQALVILRHRPRLIGRPNLVISPANRDEFLARLDEALTSCRRS